MGEETTQLELSSELDRLAAMREDGDGDDGGAEDTDDGSDDGDGEGEGPRLSVRGTVVEPRGVDGHRFSGLVVSSPEPSLRGADWEWPLHALHGEAATTTVDGAERPVDAFLDAVDGDRTGYVLDRQRYVYLAVEDAPDVDTLTPARGEDGLDVETPSPDRGGDGEDGDPGDDDTDRGEGGDDDPGDDDTDRRDDGGREGDGHGDDDTGETVTLRVVETNDHSEAAVGETVDLARARLWTATVAGYADRRRYRVFDDAGRELRP